MIRLEPLQAEDREQFIIDNQEAFNYGALEEFGLRDDHMEEDGQIISRDTIERSIEAGEAYRITRDGEKVGGAVIPPIWRWGALLCPDVDCDPGLEVDGEVILENCNPSALVEFAKIKIDKNCET